MEASVRGARAPVQLHIRYTVSITVGGAADCYGRHRGQLCLAAVQRPWEHCRMLDTAPLYHQLADHIHEMIRAGTLRAGDRVPSVRSFSQQQGVSVSTVLQAYQRLEDNGVIEARPQSGYYVRRLPAAVQEPASSRPPRRALNVEINELADAVLSNATDPEMITFGSACAAPELFPLERVRRVMASIAP